MNTKKTGFVHNTSPNAAHNAPKINANEAHLQVVDNFTCLNSTLLRNTKTDAEAQLLPHHLFSADIKTGMAGPDPGHERESSASTPCRDKCNCARATTSCGWTATDVNRRYHPPNRNPCADHSDQLRQHHAITHSSQRWDDVRRPITCHHCHQHLSTQRCGLGQYLSSLRPHIHLAHLRIHRTDTGEPMPGAPTHTRCIHLDCRHYPCTSRRRMYLLRHMRIHKNLREINAGYTAPSHLSPSPPTASTQLTSLT
nr:unnamed protein product [Spirometra erinaceieuropaei]